MVRLNELRLFLFKRTLNLLEKASIEMRHLAYNFEIELKTSGGYWVRRMRHSPQAPPFFGAPLENSIYSFGFAADVCSEDGSE